MTLPSDAMANLFAASPVNDLPEVPNYNICPTNQVVSIVSDEGARKLQSHRWGFIPHWYKKPSDGPLLINARAETIAEKPAFRAACRTRRCLIPATGFYEWTKDADDKRLPWYISPATTPMVFAGIWQTWGDLTTCAIVTVEAGITMSKIHHREPVTLAPDDWPKWLGEDGKGAATLMKPAPEGAMTAYRVDTKVNSNRASGPELIEPWDGNLS
jgi:putative SOS response-associated peptidase YedK